MPNSITVVSENIEWLEEEWNKAWDEKESGELKTVPEWWFDDAYERQLKKIDRMGLVFSKDLPTQGQASDIIGLFEPPDYGDREILKFFNVPLRGMTQTRAKYLVAQLFLEPENAAAYGTFSDLKETLAENRPATTMQKEFYRYFDLKVPTGLTHEEAFQFRREYARKLKNLDWEDWLAYEIMYEGINVSRKDYGIKKVSLSLYRAVMEEFKKEGKRPSEFDDDLLVLERIIRMQPDIKNG